MRTSVISALATAVILLGGAAHASNRLLLPVVYFGDGAAGASWAMEIIITNDSDSRLDLEGLDVIEHSCPIPEGCVMDSLPAKTAGFVAGPSFPRGVFLELPEHVVGIDIAARVAAYPRHENIAGTELPLPRDSEFRERCWLRGVPFYWGEGERDFRTWVRIYSLPTNERIRVRVSLRSKYYPDKEPIASREYELSESPAAEGILSYPGYVAFQLHNDFPEIFTASGNVEIEALPLSDGTVPRIWAFASSVNSVSAEVTVVRPATYLGE